MMGHYCDAERLKLLIADAQATGKVSDELAITVATVGEKIWYMRKPTGIELEDFVQQFVMEFLRHFRNINTNSPARWLFNYLTTSAFNELRQMLKKKSTRDATLKRYRDRQAKAWLKELGVRMDYTHRHESYRNEGPSRQGY